MHVDDARCAEVVARAAAAEHGSRLVVVLAQVAVGGPPLGLTASVREHLARWADEGAVTRVVRFGGLIGAEVGPDVVIASASNRHEDRAADIAESLGCLERELSKPVDPNVGDGVATLHALQRGGQMVPDNVVTDIVVIGSGVDTEPPLDLRVLGFGEPVQQVIDDLAALDETPRLDRIELVVLSGLGQVSDPQPQLAQGDVDFIRELWSAIVRSGGSEPVLDTGRIPDQPRADDAPSAPVVNPTPIGQIQPRPRPCGGVVATVPDTFFDGDSAQLRPGVEGELRPYAELLRPGSGTAEIIGHAHAVGDPLDGGEQALSEQRAAEITDALVRQGADRAALTVTGRGATEPVPGGSPADDRRVEITIAGTDCDVSRRS
jgi:outer membrane protein OmpA-like peptidoglycan-associated protein